jgi:hypothetical protein
MEMKNVKKWTNGKPEIQALISVFLVDLCDSLFSCVYNFNSHKQITHYLKIRNFDEWAKCYSNFFDDNSTIIETSKNLMADNIFSGFLAIKNEIDSKGSKNISNSKYADWIKEFLLDDFRIKDFQNNDNNEEVIIEKLKILFGTTQIVFAFRVMLPCIVLYQKTPQMLFKEAIKGDFNAYRTLLRLDKNLLCVPNFSVIWEEESRNQKGVRFRSLAKTLQESAYENISSAKIKILFATAIELIFKLTGHTITRAETKKLFDSYAMDTKNTRSDQELPENLDAFSRAINRQLKVLNHIYKEHTE